MRFGKIGGALLAAVAALAAGTAAAQDFKPKEAGDIVIRARGIGILPNAGGTVRDRVTGADTGLRIGSISDEATPELDFSYFITKNFALELIAASARHKVMTENGIEVGRVRHLPPTITLQYHPLPDYWISPYVGAGINYTWFMFENSGPADPVRGLRVSGDFGFAAQAGVDIAVSGRWHANLDVKRLWLRPDATTNALKVNDLRIDPWIVGAGIGYRF